MDEIRTDPTAGDRLTKRIIICTVCGVTVLVSVTMCALAWMQVQIPDQIDRAVNLLLGALVGSLIKTGVDTLIGSSSAPVKVATDPEKPLDVQEVTDPKKDTE